MCRIGTLQPDPVRIRTAASGIPTTLKLEAYLILAIRCARIDQRRPATYLIMSRNCQRITPGGEPENFDRRKRREHGDVVVTYIHSLNYFDKS